MKQLLLILIMLLVASAFLRNKADELRISDKQACEAQGAVFQCDDIKRICTCEGR